MESKQPLLSGIFYHIYNRGNGGGDIFFEERNYTYFLHLWDKHVEPIAETFAYCLMKNHFHVLIRIREEAVLHDRMKAKNSKQTLTYFCSQQLSNCFNAYAKGVSKAYHLTGSLFESRFERKTVKNKRYLLKLITYIHQNPQKHGFTEDFRFYPHSSYQSHLSDKQSKLKRATVHQLFGSKDDFLKQQENKPFINSEFEDLVVEKVVG
jgi:REP element-mobilizing transposase RayT